MHKARSAEEERIILPHHGQRRTRVVELTEPGV